MKFQRLKQWVCQSDRGSGTVAGITLFCICAFTVTVSCVIGNYMISAAIAQSAADQAAISGAWASQLSEDACSAAQDAALRNGSELTGCITQGGDVQVETAVPTVIHLLPYARAKARAGAADCPVTP